MNLTNNSFDNLPSCSYPFTKRLNNGNYVLICSTEIYFYDSYFENLKNNFTTPYICNSESCFISIACSQFLDEDDGYIILLQNGFNYIFSENGTLLSNISIPYYNEGISYSIVPYEHIGTKYFFSLIYTNSSNIIFINYSFDTLLNYISINNSFLYKDEKISNNGISCQLMKNKNIKLISCFYGQIENLYIMVKNFNPLNNCEIFSYNKAKAIKQISLSSSIYLKSDVSTKYRDKAVICIADDLNNNYIFLLGYDI